jgi:Antistasin family
MDAGASDAVVSLGGQSGSTASAGGTTSTPGTGGAMGTGGAAGSVSTGGSVGTGGVAGSLGTGGAVDAGGLAGAKGTGGMTGSGGTTRSGGSKGGRDGGVDAADVSTSDGGGRVDGAADAGAKDASASETPALPDAPVVCGPICDIYCAYGNVLDVNGCPTCACNPPPCPSMPCPSCAYGYVRDSNGCWTCTCAPVAPCGQLLDAGLCEASSHCRWLTPGCAMGANPLAQSESGCYEQVDCLTTSDCTETGSTCVDRTVAPPGDPGGDWCGMAVRICL